MRTSGSGMERKWKEFNMEVRTSLDEEDCAKDFCEELRTLMEVHEVRGCGKKRMGQAMVGFSVATLSESGEDHEEVAKIVELTMNVWLSNN